MAALTDLTPAQLAEDGVVEQVVGDWVDAHWDPDLSLGEWWQRLADSRLAHPSLPTTAYGMGWGQSLSMRAMRALAAKGVVGPPPGLGYMLAAPTIADHGNQDQIDRYIPQILNGREAWCQLFSEPMAGSDLAGLGTKAEQDGDEWAFTGQKVWTSQGPTADYGILIARTDPDLPKHKGLSYFALELQQDGVEVRPLREMTGREFFSEVFMDRAKAHNDAMIGARGEGWRVANTTLGYERSSIGGGSAGFVMASPGRIANQFDRTVGDIVTKATNRKGGGQAPGVGMKLYNRYVDLAKQLGRTSDPILRQSIAELYTMLQVNRLNVQRARDPKQRTGAEGNISKLFDSELHRRFRDVALDIIGADGMLDEKSTTTDSSIAEIVLFASAPSIYGGTDQIQKNIIGERALGLPKEPGPARDTPYKDLPKNQ